MKRGIKYLLLIISLTILVTPIGFSAISDNIISYWTFDNTDSNSTHATDIQGNNNGEKHKLVNISNGKVNQAYSFNGQNSYIEIPDDPTLDLKKEITISAWIKTNNTQRGGIFDHLHSSNYNGYTFIYGRGGSELDFYTPNTNWKDVTSSKLDNGEWHHVGITGKNRLYFYIDGQIVKNVSFDDMTASTQIAAIGRDYKPQYFKGYIDEVAIWNRSLSISEMKTIYNRSKKGNHYTTSSSTPTANNFSTAYGSTDFSTVDDITNISNMTLAVSNSKVNWNNNVNAKNQNYDKNVKLSQGLVSVNSTALDSTINSSATVSLDVSSCSSLDIYKSDKPVSSLSELKSEGTIVGDENGCSNSYCSNVSCSNGELTYDVQHFSSTGSDSTSSTETVPEFSTYTLLLAVAITILGFYTIRK